MSAVGAINQESAILQDIGSLEASVESEARIQWSIPISEEQYVRYRVLPKIQFYNRLSRKYRFWYQATSLAGIIMAASVPVLISLDSLESMKVDLSIWTTVISLFVTILVSVEKLFHFRSHWRSCEAMASFLRSERLLFQAGAGEYRQKAREKDCDSAFQCFVTRVERAMRNESNNMIEMTTQENSSE